MKAFRAPLYELGEFEEIREKLKKNTGVLQVTGCIDSQKAHFIAGLGEGMPVRVIVAPNDLRAKEIYENYRVFDRNALLFPAKDFIFFQADVHSNLLEQQRQGVITRKLAGSATKYFLGQQRSLGSVNGYVEEMMGSFTLPVRPVSYAVKQLAHKVLGR